MIPSLSRDVRVVPMGHEHLRAVLRIDKLVYLRPWSLATFRQELANPDTRSYLVAQAGPEQIGHAGMMVVVDEGHVTTVAVDPAWQGRGVATRLLLALHTQAMQRGVVAMTLEVRMGNQRAIDLYRRFGYAPAGVRKNYYSDEGEDGIVMWAHDVNLPAHAALLAGIDEGLLRER